MKLIERYISEVSEQLPNDIRQDVAHELRSNIEDMLPDEPSEADVRQALIKLGNPKKLAMEYNPKKRYLIGPDVYNSYISVIKLVIGIAAPLFLLFAALGLLADSSLTASYEDLIAELVSAVIEGCMQAAFWVTFIFIIIERSKAKDSELPFVKKAWSPDDLLTEPVPKKAKISRVEVIISLFFTVLFTVILFVNPKLISMYITTDGITHSYPLFDIERLGYYLTAVFIIALAQFIVSVWQLVQGRWTIPLAIANAVRNIAVGLLLVILFNDNQLINTDFLNKIADMKQITLTRMNEIWFSVTKVITIAIFIGICLLDSVSSFLKCKKTAVKYE